MRKNTMETLTMLMAIVIATGLNLGLVLKYGASKINSIVASVLIAIALVVVIRYLIAIRKK